MSNLQQTDSPGGSITCLPFISTNCIQLLKNKKKKVKETLSSNNPINLEQLISSNKNQLLPNQSTLTSNIKQSIHSVSHFQSQTAILPNKRSLHPLDSSITDQELSLIQSSFHTALLFPDAPLLSPTGSTIPLVTNVSFSDLLMFQSPINDSIITNILHVFYLSNLSFKYLDTHFSSSLVQRGWNYALKIFFLHENSSRYSKSTKLKPTIHDDTILIPFYIHESHWVAIVRRYINGKIYFFYSDDLNSSSTYDSIRLTLSTSNTSPLFHLLDAEWVKVTSFTYYSHSNECGPRTCLALLTIAAHPTPTNNILLPFMHEILHKFVGGGKQKLFSYKRLMFKSYTPFHYHLIILPACL